MAYIKSVRPSTLIDIGDLIGKLSLGNLFALTSDTYCFGIARKDGGAILLTKVFSPGKPEKFAGASRIEVGSIRLF